MALQRNKPIRAPLEDQAIIELYWQREETAIEETDLKYRAYLFTVAYNIVHDALDCEECLEDTYLGAWNGIPPARPNVFRAFLTTIMRRVAVNRYHSNLKKGNVPSEMTVALSELDALTDTSEEAAFDAYLLGKLISEYLRTLSERQRFVFMSRYYAAHTVDRIARDLNLSRSAVNKQLANLRSDLKKMLERERYAV